MSTHGKMVAFYNCLLVLILYNVHVCESVPSPYVLIWNIPIGYYTSRLLYLYVIIPIGYYTSRLLYL